MDGKQNSAFFHAALISFRFVLGYAHADKSARDTPNCAAHTDTGQGSHDWSCRNEWAQPRNRQGTDTCEPTQTTSDHRACACTSCCPFPREGAIVYAGSSS